MALRLADRWVWDFWHARRGGVHHLFYLQAPRALGDPDLRHWHVSIGHACSRDLKEWSIQPDALKPGPSGAWDDYTTWTGSVLEHRGLWHMLYTGTSRAEDGLVQRIGLAVSDDLTHWERFGDAPLIEADPRWYEQLDLEIWHDQAWRDPCLFRDDDGVFHAFITARSSTGDPLARGVIGHARSKDLLTWDVLPPVTEPMGLGQMEVPQLVEVAGRWYLLFCGDHGDASRPRCTGTFALSADRPAGPFLASSLRALEADPSGSSYAGKILATDDGPRFLAWERTATDGTFVGVLGDPSPVILDADAGLAVAVGQEGQSTRLARETR